MIVSADDDVVFSLVRDFHDLHPSSDSTRTQDGLHGDQSDQGGSEVNK